MVVAKTNRAHNALAHQLHDRSLSRTYSALVWDRPNPAEGTIEGAIGRHPTHRKKMAVVEQGGKAARTRYTTERSYGPADAPPLVSLVECHLETGRTHQIRVHMADIGHPLIGDPLYGRQRNPTNRRDLPAVSKQAVATLAAFPRQALHAKQICFAHPADGAQMRFFAPHPADFARLLSTLE
jgi:23S rRNA pseudouridine1911/1915/1917 synthase